MRMHDVWPFTFQPGRQAADVAKGGQAFAAHGPVQPFRPAGFYGARQRPMGAQHRDPVPLTAEAGADFCGDKLGTTDAERCKRLYDMHEVNYLLHVANSAFLQPVSVDQAVVRAAVRAGGVAGLLDRQIDAGMRVPEPLLRCRAGQRQIRPVNFVGLRRAGHSQVWILRVGGMGHESFSVFSAEPHFTLNGVRRVQWEAYHRGLNRG